MKCDRCGGTVRADESRKHQGQALCEDCYIDCLSPVKACDPWAVFTAKSFSQGRGTALELTETQSDILEILGETGGASPEEVARRLKIKSPDLEREIATLRHMEKVRGELRSGEKILRLW